MKELLKNKNIFVYFVVMAFRVSVSFCGETNDGYTILLSFSGNEYYKVHMEEDKFDERMEEKRIFMDTFDIKALPKDGYYTNISVALEKIGFFRSLQQMADCRFIRNPKFWENKKHYANNKKLFNIVFTIGLYEHMLLYKVLCSIENGEYDIAAKLLTGYFNSHHFFFKQPNKMLGRFCDCFKKRYGEINGNLTNSINHILAYKEEYYKNTPEEIDDSKPWKNN